MIWQKSQNWQKSQGIFSHISIWGLAQKRLISIEWSHKSYYLVLQWLQVKQWFQLVQNVDFWQYGESRNDATVVSIKEADTFCYLVFNRWLHNEWGIQSPL